MSGLAPAEQVEGFRAINAERQADDVDLAEATPLHMDVLSFYLQKLQRDLEETVMTEQLIQRLVAYNFAPGTSCPTFSLGKIDDGKLATAGTLISQLIAGSVVSPDEPWIRQSLGLPAAGVESAG